MTKWDQNTDVVPDMDISDKMGDSFDGTTYVHCMAEELAAIMVLANSLKMSKMNCNKGTRFVWLDFKAPDSHCDWEYW